MDRFYVFFITLFLFLLGNTVVVANEINNVRRCYEFTWLGEMYNNGTIGFRNATCQTATSLANGVPCKEPLVVSYDGTWPDVDYIWDNHRDQATCEAAASEICIRYTYYFNGHVENSTYMCGRALNNFGEVVTSGCYEQRNGTYVTRACFCSPIAGAMPCNNTSFTSPIPIVILLIAVMLMIQDVDVINLLYDYIT